MEPNNSILRAALRWLPAALWAGVIFAGSSVPGSNIPGGYSVYGHLAEYAVLAALVVAAQREPDWRHAVVVALVVCALYGASDEIHQAFVPLRVPDVIDWLNDLAGALVGAAATVAFRRITKRSAEETRGQ